MKAIIYQSKSAIQFDVEQLDELTRIASRKNVMLGLTGYLCYHRRYFFQYLEGDRETVSDMMELIAADSRHTVTRIYEDDDLLLRRFPSWHMKYLSPEVSARVGLKEVISLHFNYLDESTLFDDAWVGLVRGAVEHVSSAQRFFLDDRS